MCECRVLGQPVVLVVLSPCFSSANGPGLVTRAASQFSVLTTLTRSTHEHPLAAGLASMIRSDGYQGGCSVVSDLYCQSGVPPLRTSMHSVHTQITAEYGLPHCLALLCVRALLGLGPLINGVLPHSA